MKTDVLLMFHLLYPQPDELIASVSVLDVSCFGENDGSAILSISGGTGEYTTEDLSNISAGAYYYSNWWKRMYDWCLIYCSSAWWINSYCFSNRCFM